MQVAEIADEILSEVFSDNAGLQVNHYNTLQGVTVTPDVIFYLLDETTLPAAATVLSGFKCPVIVNAVFTTLAALPLHFSRLNAWPGFLQRDIKEVSAGEDDRFFYNNYTPYLVGN